MRTAKLKDITLTITDGKHGDCKNHDGSGYYFISCKDVYDETIHYENARQITEDDFRDADRRTNLAAYDILITNSGTIGRMALVKDIPETRKTTFQKSVAIVRADTSQVVPNYLYYLLKSKVHDFINSSNGSAQKNLLLSTMRDFDISFVDSFETQHRIATILSRYDSLIENYQKQIKLLEEAAQRLYKEWFVDLHFPGHETTKIIDGVPEGWEKNAFGSIIDYEIGGGWGSDTKTTNEIIPAYVIRGTDMSTLDMGIWKELPYRFHQESNYRARQLMHNDIIFEVSGGSKNEGVAKTFLVQQELLDKLDNHVICASFCKLIRLKDSSIAYYIYDTLKEWRASGITAQYDKRSASSIVNYRWKDFLSQQEILIPNEIVLRDYIKKSELIHSSITKKSSQIRLLTEARDRLLPKLMSGEIAV